MVAQQRYCSYGLAAVCICRCVLALLTPAYAVPFRVSCMAYESPFSQGSKVRYCTDVPQMTPAFLSTPTLLAQLSAHL